MVGFYVTIRSVLINLDKINNDKGNDNDKIKMGISWDRSAPTLHHFSPFFTISYQSLNPLKNLSVKSSPALYSSKGSIPEAVVIAGVDTSLPFIVFS